MWKHWKSFSLVFENQSKNDEKSQAEFYVETLFDVSCFHFQVMLSYATLVFKQIGKFLQEISGKIENIAEGKYHSI